jgi:hypothetical protein
MNTIRSAYVNKYGNFSHILTININNSLSQDEKNTILYDIYDFINEKDISKHISNMDITLKWRVYDKTDLLHYYTDGNGILSDKGVYEHTKLLVNDIKKLKNGDNITIVVNKPLTKSICIM